MSNAFKQGRETRQWIVWFFFQRMDDAPDGAGSVVAHGWLDVTIRTAPGQPTGYVSFETRTRARGFVKLFDGRQMGRTSSPVTTE